MYFKALYLICICIEENCDDASIKDNWAEMAQASLICLPGNPDDAHIQLNTNLDTKSFWEVFDMHT